MRDATISRDNPDVGALSYLNNNGEHVRGSSRKGGQSIRIEELFQQTAGNCTNEPDGNARNKQSDVDFFSWFCNRTDTVEGEKISLNLKICKMKNK